MITVRVFICPRCNRNHWEDFDKELFEAHAKYADHISTNQFTRKENETRLALLEARRSLTTDEFLKVYPAIQEGQPFRLPQAKE